MFCVGRSGILKIKVVIFGQILVMFSAVHLHQKKYIGIMSSVAQLCPTLCDPMDYSMSGFPDHHQLPNFAQTHVHRVSDAIQPSHTVVPFSSRLQSFPASGPFPMSQFFASHGQSIGASSSASASVLPMNIQD